MRVIGVHCMPLAAVSALLVSARDQLEMVREGIDAAEETSDCVVPLHFAAQALAAHDLIRTLSADVDKLLLNEARTADGTI